MAKFCKKLLSILLIIILTLNFTACSTVRAEDLMKGIEPNNVTGTAPDEAFIDSQMRLSLDLFKATVAENKNSNVLISPLSIELALAMTANGADGKTREEMETLLGGDISLEDLNEYLYYYMKHLPSGKKYKFQSANSIWFRDDADRLSIEQDFLQLNADYYGASIYKDPFDDGTVKDINNWVKNKTDGTIKKIVNDINDDDIMYLINAMIFDAEWKHIYESTDISDSVFTSITGSESTVKMMRSAEVIYLKDENATGFMKPYKGEEYCFAALLPNENINIYNYINSLDSKTLLNIFQNAEADYVTVGIPKFSYECSIDMDSILGELGIDTAFDEATADFSKMGTSTDGNIHIGGVLHKTYISVDEKGTKAGAATKVEVEDTAAMISPNIVILDRPFIYMIIDNETNLPLFMGIVTDIP